MGNTKNSTATTPNATSIPDATPQNSLIYGLDDRPPLREALFAALQHLLAIFVAIITPPLIIAGALQADIETTSTLVSTALIASGISTFIQCRRIGPVGCGLLCIQGTSFSFIGPIISAGLSGGLATVFGACIVGSSVEIAISRVLKYTKHIITPLVSGIVVTLIGMSLIKVGITACGGGQEAIANNTFGSLRFVGLAALVLVSIIIFNRSSNRYLRMSSIVIGLAIGYVSAYFMGMVDFSSVNTQNIINLPHPFKYGLKFDPAAIIGLALIYMITAIEAYGDITANSLISGQPVEGPLFVKRASGGIMGDGVGSLISGCLCCFPNSIFAQKQRHDTAHGSGQSLRRLFHCGNAHHPRPLPCHRHNLQSDARSRLGWSNASHVRHRCCCRHQDYRLAGNQQKSHIGHRPEFQPRIERGIDTRNLEPIANDVEKPLLIRHHHRRTDCHSL